MSSSPAPPPVRPARRTTSVLRSAARRCALMALLGLPVAGATAPGAWADGPGYGGDADALSVSWSGDGSVTTAAAVPGQSTSGGSAATGHTLVVSGLGFRSRSPVEVQVGDLGVADSRSDPVGHLAIEVPGARTGPLEPGTSVLAKGRAPSGSTRVLVGAVPPLPSGTGPRDVVPWVLVAAVGLGVLRRPGRRAAPAQTAQAGSKR